MKIEVIGESYYSGAVPTETGNFRKWIKMNYPDIEFPMPENTPKYALHDFSLILPFVSLAIDGSLENYLKLVLEYVEFTLRGRLEGEKNIIEFKVNYTNKNNGEKKEFYFKGSEEALKKTVKKFNINEFMKD